MPSKKTNRRILVNGAVAAKRFFGAPSMKAWRDEWTQLSAEEKREMGALAAEALGWEPAEEKANHYVRAA